MHSPIPSIFENLELIHTRDYLNAVMTGKPRQLAESSSYSWNTNIFESAAANCGGVVEAYSSAQREQTAGSLSIDLHHAQQERGRLLAFPTHSRCLFHQEFDARVLNIDLDAHCCRGVHSFVAATQGFHQLDVSGFFQPIGLSLLAPRPSIWLTLLINYFNSSAALK